MLANGSAELTSMRLTVVGSGDAFGSGGRFNTCFLIEAERTILLDCGASSLVALRAIKREPNEVDGVVLSHLHGDHFGGLVFLLIDAQYLSRRERPLTIAGPPGTRERLLAALEVFFPGSSQTAWRFAWNVVEITPGEPGEVLGFKINTAEVIHQSGAPSTAVRLTTGANVLAYSGDTEWTDALLPIAKGADLFIVECYEYGRPLTGHLYWGLLKDKLAEFKAKRIMITHMNHTMLERRDEARAYGVLIAEDGLVLEI
jgi:ribonuclease BN (tRNA processing enzyme)